MESLNDKTQKSGFGEKLKSDWLTFVVIILNPWVAIFLILTVVFVILKVRIPSTITIPQNIDVALEVVISILAGIVGALLMQGWDKVKQQSILITRGQSAIRGLKLLLNSIGKFEERVEKQLKILSDNQQSHVLVQSYYDEIVDRCNLLQEEVIDAIEEWQDIIPEVANLKTQIGLITTLQSRSSQLEEQIAQITLEMKSLQSTNEHSQGELLSLREQSNTDQQEVNRLSEQLKKNQSRSEELAKRLESKEQELSSVRRVIGGANPYAAQFSASDVNTAAFIFPSTADERRNYSVAPVILNRMCSKCGHQYTTSYLAGQPGIDMNECPKCGPRTYFLTDTH